MALHRHPTSSSSNPDDKPRSEAVSWFDLARVVYAWTDVRKSDIDRAWWRQTLRADDFIAPRDHALETATVH